MEFALAEDPKSPISVQPQAPAGAVLAPLPPYFGELDPAKAAKAAAASLALRQGLTLQRDPITGALQDPSETEQAFRSRIARLREEARRSEEDKTLDALARQLDKAEDRVRKFQLKADADQSEASARNTETMLSAGLGVLGGLFGSRRSIGGAVSRTASKYRQADRAKDRVEADRADLESATRERDDLKAKLEEERRGLAERYADQKFETVTLAASKSGVQVLSCGLLWMEE